MSNVQLQIYRAIAAHVLVIFTMLLSACAPNHLERGREDFYNNNFESAIEHFKLVDTDQGRSMLRDAERSISIKKSTQQGDELYREGRIEEAVAHYVSAINASDRIIHKTDMIRVLLERDQERVGKYYFRKLSEWEQNSQFGKIAQAYKEVLGYLSQSQNEYSLIEGIGREAERKLNEANTLRKQGEDFFNQGEFQKAIDSWRQAMRIAPELEATLSIRIYEAEQALESSVRERFFESTRKAKEEYRLGHYENTVSICDDALRLSKAHPNIVLDKGSVRRYKRLAQECIEDLATRRATQAETERQNRIKGIPLTPFAIDYSRSDRISAVGNSKLQPGKTDRWRGKAVIGVDVFRTLYSEVDLGYEVRVFKDHDQNDPHMDLVSSVYRSHGRINYKCADVDSGMFYSRVTNVRGRDEYELESTLYHELDH